MKMFPDVTVAVALRATRTLRTAKRLQKVIGLSVPENTPPHLV